MKSNMILNIAATATQPVLITLVNRHPEMTAKLEESENDGDAIKDLSKEKEEEQKGIWTRMWQGIKSAGERVWGWIMAAIPTS